MQTGAKCLEEQLVLKDIRRGEIVVSTELGIGLIESTTATHSVVQWLNVPETPAYADLVCRLCSSCAQHPRQVHAKMTNHEIQRMTCSFIQHNLRPLEDDFPLDILGPNEDNAYDDSVEAEDDEPEGESAYETSDDPVSSL